MNLTDTHNPDIIYGTESWLNPDILSSELFPSGYSVYHHDREDGYGGVFIACQDSLTSCNLEIPNNSCEIVACEIELLNNTKLAN